MTERTISLCPIDPGNFYHRLTFKHWRELIERRVRVPRGCLWATREAFEEGVSWHDAVQAIRREGAHRS